MLKMNKSKTLPIIYFQIKIEIYSLEKNCEISKNVSDFPQFRLQKKLYNRYCLNVVKIDLFFSRVPKLFFLVFCNFLVFVAKFRQVSWQIWRNCLACLLEQMHLFLILYFLLGLTRGQMWKQRSEAKLRHEDTGNYLKK